MLRRYILPLLALGLLLASCSYTQKVRDGRTAYQYKQYSVAADMLEKEYNKAKTRVEKGKLAYLLGETYKKLNKSEKSIQWYKIAYDNQAGVDALREYAYALKRAEQYKEALQAFKDLGIEIGSPYEYRREMNAIQVAMGWKDIKTPEYRITLPEFNTKYADYAPVLYKDNQLVFTSDRASSTGDDVYKWTGNKFSDLFIADLKSNNISAFSNQINSPNNDGTPVFNQQYTEMYFTRCFGGKKDSTDNCKIMVSAFENSAWSVPKALNFVKPGVNYGDPSLSADGKELYFVSNDPEGWGGHDIYVSKRTPDGWSDPDLLGRTINTIGEERFPYIDHDTLYFSSDFHPGMGGLDIFKVVKMSNGTWSSAYNLKPPINSGGDDFGYIIDNQAKLDKDVLQVGYFTSTRADGLGNDDIYRFEKIVPPPAPPVAEVPKKVEPKLILDVYVLEKIHEDPANPNSRVLGRKPLADAKLEAKLGKDNKNFTTGEDGLVSIEVQPGTDYNFLASKETYLNKGATFTTKGIGADPNNPVQHFEVEIVLDKIYLNREIRLENIYYDFDKWNIREDAKPTLDELAENLKLNPNIRIELASHTDCRGTSAYNEELSQKRAQSAVEYLISKGIEANRLTAKGYGENVPEATCACSRCTEEEHQLNRRTTFKIIE